MSVRHVVSVCVALVAIVPLNSISRADQFDEATAYFKTGDSERAIELLNAIAETGDAATQYRVGTELIGFDDIGARWIESAAERGHADAQADMGLLYAAGTFVEQDLARSFMWYFLAVQGDLTPSRREGALENMKRVYAAMSSSNRRRAERLIAQWKPK